MAMPTAPTIGALIRDWRHRRRMSQLDLAVEAEVSSRHLSFVETGRARPSRELLIDLADHLQVPLRERNSLLVAAGFAPLYRETPLDTAEMTPVRQALDRLLAGHEPFPAIVVDRHWNLVSGNHPGRAILSEGVSTDLLKPPVNALRVTLHPDGLAPRIGNFPEYSAHLMEQLHRQTMLAGDPKLAALEAELRGYPGVDQQPLKFADRGSPLFVPMLLRVDGRDLSFFNTLTTFGAALDITIAELTIEALFPADEETAAALRNDWGSAR